MTMRGVKHKSHEELTLLELVLQLRVQEKFGANRRDTAPGGRAPVCASSYGNEHDERRSGPLREDADIE